MRFLLILLFPFLAHAGTTTGSILLHNDTTFILTAIIQAADGSYLGQFSVQPGQQRNFTSSMLPTQYVHPGAPDISQTPYTVIWQCPSKGTYATCTYVSPGAYVRASSCDGSHYCTPKEESGQAPASTIQKKK